MERLENFKVQVGIIILLEILSVVLLFILADASYGFMLGVTVFINVVLIGWIVYRFETDKENRDMDITRILGNDAKEALTYGQIGLLTYNDQYVVTWINDFLEERVQGLIGKKATSWIGDINELFQGEVDSILVKDKEYVYEISKKEESQVLFIKDVTKYENLLTQYKEEGVVLGLLHLDNYMETSQYEDETKIATINSSLRQPLVEWAKKYGMLIRRLRSDRFLVVLNEKIFQKVTKDKFDILTDIRNGAQELDVPITLSMAFASGSADMAELDVMVNDLIELAQSRGGDQVAIKHSGEDVKYFGGNSESTTNRSRVRVRVMSQALKDVILQARRVFIVGHKNMDFDCMGASLMVSRLVSAYDREAYIVSKSGGIEPQLSDALDLYSDKFLGRHIFISEIEALKLLGENDLVIAVDFHNSMHCNAPMILDRTEKTVVIDHHRRTENFIENPILVYVESGASSVCELMTELIPYQTNKLDLNEDDALFMYLGILIDTNRFKMRTGSRTFEAAAVLKKKGVDPIAAENLLKENYDEFKEKATILRFAKKYQDNILIAPVETDEFMSRTGMSQVADQLLTVKDVEASFVIAYVKENTVAVSARSRGVINVQTIMEHMNGGGHFSAAALQRENATVSEIYDELIQTINKINEQEVVENESDIIK